MPKINREEYETLTELSDKWKWIATDGDGYVWGYENRPKKLGGTQLWDDFNGGQYKYFGPNLFQFIQWGDEEPYSIDELIDEYEEAIRVNSQIDKLAKFIMSEVEGEPSQSESAVDTAIRIIKSYQNQKTLPKVWVDEHAEYYGPLGRPVVPVNDLQNPLVPKQEENDRYIQGWVEGIAEYVKDLESGENLIVVDKPTVPQYVAEWYESEGKRDRWWNWFYKWGKDKSETELEAKTIKWMQDYNEEAFVNMFLYGYTVEEEQKYYVDLDEAAYVARWVGDGSVQIHTDSISWDNEYEFYLTEQEIKDYDPRFWPFAVKVEELEGWK